MIYYWANMYYYAPLNRTYQSHWFLNEHLAKQASLNKFPKYKTLYRIRSKIKMIQRFIGLSISLLANSFIVSLVDNWRIGILGIVCAVGGVLYGSAK